MFPTNHSACRKVSFVLSQFTRLTDERTHGLLMAKTSLHICSAVKDQTDVTIFSVQLSLEDDSDV